MNKNDSALDLAARVSRAVTNHLPSLDGIRGIAILLVLLHNLDTIVSPQTLSAHLVGFVADRGWIGVQLFFVLSGFLITGILLDTRRDKQYFRTFFGRRVLRIFPLYYLVLIIAFVVIPNVVILSADTQANHRYQIWLWLYLSNWFQPFDQYVHGFGHFWSLAVEEQFYLIWPFVIRKLSPRGVIRLSVGIIVAAFFSRLLIRLLDGEAEVVYDFTICRMDALAVGAGVAAIARLPQCVQRIQQSAKILIGATLVVGIVGALLSHGYDRTQFGGQIFGYGIVAILFGAIILAAVLAEAQNFIPLTRLLSWRPLRTLGKYSYGVYVYHRFVQELVGDQILQRISKPTVATDLLFVGCISLLTLVIAFCSYHLFEKRFLEMKRYFVPESAVHSQLA